MSPSTTQTIDQTRVGSFTVLTLRDSLTRDNAMVLKDYCRNLVSGKKLQIILDCKSIPYMDSQGLETLLSIHHTLKQGNGSFVLVGLNEVCNDIMIATRLASVLMIDKDIHQVIKKGL